MIIENDDGTVTISMIAYNRLVEDSQWLSALEQAGVDNWQGYEDAQDIMDNN